MGEIKSLKNLSPILLIFILSTAISFYLLFPLLKNGPAGAFFSIDPDVHYIGNVISYIKSHQISYINHPATPTIIAYVLALTPLRFYAKFMLHTSFVDWFILHSEIIYLYLRIFQSLLFGIGLFIFSLAVYRITRVLILSIFSIISLFIFYFMTDMALHMRSETTSFLIVSIWLLIFTSFISSQKLSKIFLLAFISGLAVANKFTNVFYFLATIGLIISLQRTSLTKKIIIAGVNISIGFISFIFFTWPIKERYPKIIQYIFDLFPQSAVGAGNINSLFDIKIYFHKLYSLFLSEFWPGIVVILTFIFVIYLFVKRKRDILTPLYLFAAFMFAGILIFARYPLNYYQITNFVGVVFVLYTMLQKFNKYIYLLFIIFSIIVSIKNFLIYYPQTSQTMFESAALENFISERPVKKGIIWEYGRTKDFALLWGNSWSGASYSENLKKLRPDLLFEIDFQQNYLNDKRDLFSYCWDKFYMQKTYFDSFKEKFKNNHFTYLQIPDSNNMYVVERNTCES